MTMTQTEAAAILCFNGEWPTWATLVQIASQRCVSPASLRGLLSRDDPEELHQAATDDSWEPLIRAATTSLEKSIAWERQLLETRIAEGHVWVADFEKVCDPNHVLVPDSWLGVSGYMHSGVEWYGLAVLALPGTHTLTGTYFRPTVWLIRGCQVVYAGRRDRVEESQVKIVAHIRGGTSSRILPTVFQATAGRGDVSLGIYQEAKSYSRPGMYAGCD